MGRIIGVQEVDMTVYVDDVRHTFGRTVMCHMWADSLDELLNMAVHLNLNHKWLQKPPTASWVHFDISLGLKVKAIAQGAVLTDKYGPVEHLACLDISSGDPERAERGKRKLDQIKKCRSL
jgi:hypothetical protein